MIRCLFDDLSCGDARLSCPAFCPLIVGIPPPLLPFSSNVIPSSTVPRYGIPTKANLEAPSSTCIQADITHTSQAAERAADGSQGLSSCLARPTINVLEGADHSDSQPPLQPPLAAQRRSLVLTLNQTGIRGPQTWI